jgi:hypothetical protein
MDQVDKEVRRCTVPSCAQPVRVGVIRWEARSPVLVTDLLGRTYCPTCHRGYRLRGLSRTDLAISCNESTTSRR